MAAWEPLLTRSTTHLVWSLHACKLLLKRPDQRNDCGRRVRRSNLQRQLAKHTLHLQEAGGVQVGMPCSIACSQTAPNGSATTSQQLHRGCTK